MIYLAMELWPHLVGAFALGIVTGLAVTRVERGGQP